MKCPFCGNDETGVVDTRVSEEGDIVRRRRKCSACDKRFTTYERAEIQLPQVVKKNDVGCVFEGEVELADAVEVGPYCVLKNVKVRIRLSK